VSKRRKYILAILGKFLLLILTAWSPWDALLYHGDGKFSDGLFFYPRYRVDQISTPSPVPILCCFLRSHSESFPDGGINLPPEILLLKEQGRGKSQKGARPK